MPHTPEQRSAHALCGAKRHDGSTCRAYAGQGTDHKGYGQCKNHGGSTPNGNKHALTLEAKQSMVARSVPVANAEPHMVLLEELSYSAGHVGWLRDAITKLDPAEIGGDRSKVLLHRYDDERDRLARIAKVCSEAGVEEARLQIDQARAAMMVSVIRDAAGEIGLNRDQLNALGSAMRGRLALMSGDDETAEAADAQVAKLRERIEAQEEERIERAAARRPPADLEYPPEEWVAEPPSAT